mgnify:CR=1 FL=1
MAISIADNFGYFGTKPFDSRLVQSTIAVMKALPASSLYEGIIIYCEEDGKTYQYKSSNDTDETYGKWREFSGSSGVTSVDSSSICSNVEETTIASKGYSVGENLILNGILYEVTKNISSGGTIIPREEIEVFSESKEINNSANNFRFYNNYGGASYYESGVGLHVKAAGANNMYGWVSFLKGPFNLTEYDHIVVKCEVAHANQEIDLCIKDTSTIEWYGQSSYSPSECKTRGLITDYVSKRQYGATIGSKYDISLNVASINKDQYIILYNGENNTHTIVTDILLDNTTRANVIPAHIVDEVNDLSDKFDTLKNGHTISGNGIDVTDRSILDFSDKFEVTDDSENEKTKIDIKSSVLLNPGIITNNIENGQTASKTYVVGDLVILNYNLYKVIDTIQAGDGFFTAADLSVKVFSEVEGINTGSDNFYVWNKPYAVSAYSEGNGIYVASNSAGGDYESIILLKNLKVDLTKYSRVSCKWSPVNSTYQRWSMYVGDKNYWTSTGSSYTPATGQSQNAVSAVQAITGSYNGIQTANLNVSSINKEQYIGFGTEGDNSKTYITEITLEDTTRSPNIEKVTIESVIADVISTVLSS